MDEIYIFQANGVEVYVVTACGWLPSEEFWQLS